MSKSTDGLIWENKVSLESLSLYLMQNEVGLIKIGRSYDPEMRRRQLAAIERCDIRLLHVWPRKGAREEAIHIALDDYRIAGEWFEGGDEARAAICAKLKLDPEPEWPFDFDADAAEDWLDGFFDRQFDKATQRDVGRQHDILRNAVSAGWIADLAAWDMHWLFETGYRTIGHVTRDAADNTIVFGFFGGEQIQMPQFTASVEVAMTLWSDASRPERWDGTALECCKAAMDERRREWNANRSLLRKQKAKADRR